jgi:ribosomal protein L10
MTVAQSIAFRRELKKQGIAFKVAKNTLIARALDRYRQDNISENVLKGQTSSFSPAKTQSLRQK